MPSRASSSVLTRRSLRSGVSPRTCRVDCPMKSELCLARKRAPAFRSGRSVPAPPVATSLPRVDDAVELEVHRVGVAPGAAPREAPLLEGRDHLPVDLSRRPALVLGDVEVERQPES